MNFSKKKNVLCYFSLFNFIEINLLVMRQQFARRLLVQYRYTLNLNVEYSYFPNKTKILKKEWAYIFNFKFFFTFNNFAIQLAPSSEILLNLFCKNVYLFML